MKSTAEYERLLDDTLQSSGFPTAFWRPTKFPTEVAVAPFHAPRSLAVPQVPSDWDIRNAKDTLKGQASLHSASMGDRHRFAADTSAAAVAAVWASDASDLVNFHHRLIRKVVKSGLQPVKEPPSMKKTKKAADIEDLRLSESGLFRPKYPIDESLKSLRMLKKNLYPEVVRREREEAARLANAAHAAREEACARQTRFLRAGIKTL